MPKHLSSEWLQRYLELGSALPEVPGGCTARVAYVVPGSPDGEARFVLSYLDGRMVGAGPGPGDEPDVTLTTTYPDAVGWLRGELDANAAYMSGRTKVVGRTGPLLDVLALMGTPRYEELRAELASATEF